jgi:VIT1/CCC1 family predicted Fe2+/Mn2+ transporter
VYYNKLMKEKHTHIEPHHSNRGQKLNWLRAGVLGANDGIISMAGLVIGVASATSSHIVILTAGIAGIIAGAISMAAGEYVSVSSSLDSEKALLKLEEYELKHYTKEELEELVCIYENKGLSRETALRVAKELTEHDAMKAHFDAELRIDPNELTSPWHAAFASCIAFLSGAVIPLLAVLLPSASVRIPCAFISVIIALILTGTISAKVGKANILRAVIRVVIGGTFAMVVTYGIGRVFKMAGL